MSQKSFKKIVRIEEFIEEIIAARAFPSNTVNFGQTLLQKRHSEVFLWIHLLSFEEQIIRKAFLESLFVERQSFDQILT